MQETRVQSLGQEEFPGEGNGSPLQYSFQKGWATSLMEISLHSVFKISYFQSMHFRYALKLHSGKWNSWPFIKTIFFFINSGKRKDMIVDGNALIGWEFQLMSHHAPEQKNSVQLNQHAVMPGVRPCPWHWGYIGEKEKTIISSSWGDLCWFQSLSWQRECWPCIS